MKTRVLLLVAWCMLVELMMVIHAASFAYKAQTDKEKGQQLLKEIQKYMQNVIKEIKEEAQNTTKTREFRYDIFPGTNWCGRGHKSPDGNKLGWLRRTDACCRQHDRCPYAIHAQKQKWGFQNTKSYTMSACECDNAFHNCLFKVPQPKMSKLKLSYYKELADKVASSTVGQMFFDWLEVECLENTHFFAKDEKELPIGVNADNGNLPGNKPLPGDLAADVGISVTTKKPKPFPFWNS